MISELAAMAPICSPKLFNITRRKSPAAKTLNFMLYVILLLSYLQESQALGFNTFKYHDTTPTSAPTEMCVLACNSSLSSLDDEVFDLSNRLKADVNFTVSEISLEMEIIVLQHFESVAKRAEMALDAATASVLAPTDAIFAEYDALLRELVPDVLPALASAASGARAQQLPVRQTLLTADDSHSQPSSFAASPLTATLVVLGGLFAGVATASGGRDRWAYSSACQQRYEALL